MKRSCQSNQEGAGKRMTSRLYVQTSLFQTLKSDVVKEMHYLGTQYIVGSKGVGKSSLLIELHNAARQEDAATNDKRKVQYFSRPRMMFQLWKDEDIKWIEDRNPITLFIDNVHELPADSDDFTTLKYILKDCKVHDNRCVVVATSRYGLASLIHRKLISSDDIENLYCVNPEEETSNRLFKTLMDVEELKPIHKEVLEYVGYVPAMVKKYAQYLQSGSNVSLMKFEDLLVNEVVTFLETEAKDLGESQNDIRTRTLAILAMNKTINIIEEGWTPANMIWSCLKASPTGPWIEEISVVSPLVYSGVVQYVNHSPVELIRVVEMMKLLTQDKVGNEVGRFWERIIFDRLKVTKEIEYFYYDATTPLQHHKAAVSFTGFPYKAVSLKKLSKILESNTKSEPQLLYCPNAAGFDFIIYDDKGKTHAIQATVQEPVKKCQKDNKFYEDQSVDYKYILTPHEVDNATINKKNKLFEAFTLHNLRIIIPSSFIQEKLLNTFRK